MVAWVDFIVDLTKTAIWRVGAGYSAKGFPDPEATGRH